MAQLRRIASKVLHAATVQREAVGSNSDPFPIVLPSLDRGAKAQLTAAADGCVVARLHRRTADRQCKMRSATHRHGLAHRHRGRHHIAGVKAIVLSAAR